MKQGIPKIKIPIRKSEFTIDKAEKYLEKVYSIFSNNASKIRTDYDMYCLDHEILTKVRTHEDTTVNNIVLVPDLKAMVDWKVGYCFGNPIKYAQNKSIDTDDIHYLTKYVRDVCQRAIDKEVAKWAYSTGLGYYFIEPQSEKFDIETESPYVLYHKESDTCAKVYSSYGANEALFDILYTTYQEEDDVGYEKEVYVIDLYTNTHLYTYEKRYGDTKWQRKSSQSRGMSKPLPLVEKRLNADGIGMVAMGKSLQYAVDNILSNGLDNIEDIVNEVFVYKNVILGKTPEEKSENHKKMRKGGAIELISTSKDLPADVTTISTKLNLAEVRELFALINEKFHSTLGVPLATSNTNSGGTTKQGSEVANGYDNAYNRALDDINTFLLADTELLKKILWICKNTIGNKVDKLSSSEIEIKYSLNLTDNMLTKSQSYGTFIQTMPPSMALRLTRLSNDPEAEGKLIEESAVYQAYMASLTSKQTTNDNENQDNQDNNLDE